MGLFSSNYNRPGPGVPKDAPKKKGIMRLLEIIGRDMGSLFKVNLLFALCSLPTLIFAIVFATITAVEGFFLGFFIIFLVLIALSGILLGPATAATQAVLIEMLRDEPGYVWHTFRHKFKQNFKPAAFLGVFFSIVFTLEAVAGFFYLASLGSSSGDNTTNILLIALYLFNLILVFSVSHFSFMQVIFLDLKNFAILKNSLLLTFGMAKRSLPGTLFSLVFIAATVLFLPYTAIFYILFIPVLILLVADMWMWPVMDKTFSISEQLVARREENYFGEDGNKPEL